VCRQIGISDPTFYTWKKKYAEMSVSELRKLKQLEDENARLRRIVADPTLEGGCVGQALDQAARQRGLPRAITVVRAEVVLTHCAEVKVTDLGEDDGLFGAVDVDPGASSGDTSDGPKGRGGQSDREAVGLLA
jgi:Transposase